MNRFYSARNQHGQTFSRVSLRSSCTSCFCWMLEPAVLMLRLRRFNDASILAEDTTSSHAHDSPTICKKDKPAIFSRQGGGCVWNRQSADQTSLVQTIWDLRSFIAGCRTYVNGSKLETQDEMGSCKQHNSEGSHALGTYPAVGHHLP